MDSPYFLPDFLYELLFHLLFRAFIVGYKHILQNIGSFFIGFC